MRTAILRNNSEYLILCCNEISHRYGDRKVLRSSSVTSITRPRRMTQSRIKNSVYVVDKIDFVAVQRGLDVNGRSPLGSKSLWRYDRVWRRRCWVVDTARVISETLRILPASNIPETCADSSLRDHQDRRGTGSPPGYYEAASH